MNARRLEEIFEECVTAYLEGRRSIEQSLSLYPAYADELAPLLRTAVRFSESFQKVTPPAQAQERGRQRFLADARARRNVRALTVGSRRQSWFAGFWGQHYLGFAGGAAMIVMLTIAVSSAAILYGGSSGGGDGGPGVVLHSPVRPTPEAVTNIQNRINVLQAQVDRGEPVTAENISLLSEATSKLTTASPDEVQGSIDRVQQVLQDADSLLTNVATTQPDVADQAKQAQNTIRDVASSFNLPIVSATAAASATPAPSGEATPVPTAAATDAPTVTPEPTQAPATDTPAPIDTPVERGLP
jgi:hypothetical protein